MFRILSTYLFVSKRLTPELLTPIAGVGFHGVEIFATRGHFDYSTRAEVRSMAIALADHRLQLTSLHAPTSRDLSVNRQGGTPLSITEVERVRRIEAMDELKRVLDVAEDLPFSRLILHMGGSREVAEPRKRDAAFSSLEHLTLHAKHLGVTVCIENTTSEMGEPAYLRAFVDETRLSGLRFNFDIGHAHLAEGPVEDGVAKSFEALRNLVASAHIHDNHGEKDEHLPPFDGAIAWPAAIKVLKTAPNANLPLVIELKEKTGPEAPSAADHLEAARKAMDRFGEEWE